MKGHLIFGDIHGEDIERILKEFAEDMGIELIEWGESKYDNTADQVYKQDHCGGR